MSQRKALFSALAVTAVVLAATVGIVFSMPSFAQGPATEPAAQTETLAPPADTISATDLTPREQAFKAQIERANQQLQNSYEQVRQLEAQNQMLQQRDGQLSQRLAESNQIVEQLNAQTTQVAQRYDDDEYGEHEEHKGFTFFGFREHDDD